MTTIPPGGVLTLAYALTAGDRELDPAGVLSLRLYRADGLTDPYALDGSIQVAARDLPIMPDGAAGIDPSLTAAGESVTLSCQYPYPVTSDIGPATLTAGNSAALPGGLADQPLVLTASAPFIQGDGTTALRAFSTAFTLTGTGVLAPGYVPPLAAPAYTGAYADAGAGGVGNEAADIGDEPGSLASAGGVLAGASGQAGVSYAQAGSGGVGDEAVDIGDEAGSLVGAAGGIDLSRASWSFLWGKPTLGAEDLYGYGVAASVQDLLIPLLGTKDVLAPAASGTGAFSADITASLVALADDLKIGLSLDGVTADWMDAVWITNNAPNPNPPYWAALTLDGTLAPGCYLAFVRAAGQVQMLDLVTLT